MTHADANPGAADPAGTVAAGPLAGRLLRLARPHQWFKGIFVLVGPLYALADPASGLEPTTGVLAAAAAAFVAFGFASSACYVVNDIRDREADRLHPRKCRRPIAAGAVSLPAARVYAAALLVLSAVAVAAVPTDGRWLVGGAALLYVLNVNLYSLAIKRVIILDVVSLAVGFVLRVLGGCAAVGVHPSSWLLNCTFFLAMFLAFGKRLGERRTMGSDVASIRGVQSAYTDDLLRMAVVVTAVSTLLCYTVYVEAREAGFLWGFNLLWLTVLPATYGLLRCIVLLEGGSYDDPTMLATRDRPFQLATVTFAALTVGVVLFIRTRTG